MKKVIELVLFGILGAGVVFGGTITGVVTSKADGVPLSGVCVDACGYNDGYWYSGYTDENGVYRIDVDEEEYYSVEASGADGYLGEYYDGTTRYDQAKPVWVGTDDVVEGIDFALTATATISGVVSNSLGQAIEGIDVDCWVRNGDYGTGATTDANGFYEVTVPVGDRYCLFAYPDVDSDYAIVGKMVDVFETGQYDEDLVLGDEGYSISGHVTDRDSGQAVSGIWVACWNDDMQLWVDVQTQADGGYTLTNLPGGVYDVSVEADSGYAAIGRGDIEVWGDVVGMDFAIFPGASICGRVIDAESGAGVGGVLVDAWSDAYNVGNSASTNADGIFCVDGLPGGIIEVKAEPDFDSGYAWSLPWGSDWVCVGEGEHISGRYITIQKGAVLQGYVKDPSGNGVESSEIQFAGRDSDLYMYPGQNGYYEIRLPVGTYTGSVDMDDGVCQPVSVTVTDVNQVIDMPDIVRYGYDEGLQVCGQVENPDGYEADGAFFVVAFEAGKDLSDANDWYTVQPAAMAGVNESGAFCLGGLTPGADYDVYFGVDDEDGAIERVIFRDSAVGVAAGTSGIVMHYNSEGGLVSGAVLNQVGEPVVGALVLAYDSAGNFAGFSYVGCGEQYSIMNLPAGSYTLFAVHSRYATASASVTIVEGGSVDAPNIVMPFGGVKEGGDFNGDGIVTLADFAELASQWRQSGTLPENLDQSGLVDLSDLARWSETWLWEAMWRTN